MFKQIRKTLGIRQAKTDNLDDIIIAVVGPAGAGKSLFIKIITELAVSVGHSLESCTSEVKDFRISIPELAHGDLVFVDTPGFGNTLTHESDVDILKRIAGWLKSTYESKDIKLSGLLYFHRMSDKRMVDTPLKNLPMFEELCGAKTTFHNIMLVTTMWDEVDQETGLKREKELEKEHWRAMLNRSSTISRFMGTRESGFTLIDPLINRANERSSALLKQELVDMHKKLPATSAARQLFSNLELLVRQREVLLQQTRSEMKRTEAYGNKMSLKPLEKEYERLKINLELTVNEMRRLKLPLGKRVVKMTENFGTKFTFVPPSP